MLDPQVVVVILALAAAGLVALGWAISRRRGGRGRTHQLGREDSISYFRDFGSSASGVREEEGVGRWGGRGDPPA